jgi:hypothetical protein
MYIGKVLNIYTKGSGSHYGSVLTTDGASGLSALLLRVYWLIAMGQCILIVNIRSLIDCHVFRMTVPMTTIFWHLTLLANTYKNLVYIIHMCLSAISYIILNQLHLKVEGRM